MVVSEHYVQPSRSPDDHTKTRTRCLSSRDTDRGFKMSKVFMDGGSGLNLIFFDTIKSMGITMKMLEDSDTCFHGILPTSPAYSLGKVYLNVVDTSQTYL